MVQLASAWHKSSIGFESNAITSRSIYIEGAIDSTESGVPGEMYMPK